MRRTSLPRTPARAAASALAALALLLSGGCITSDDPVDQPASVEPDEGDDDDGEVVEDPAGGGENAEPGEEE